MDELTSNLHLLKIFFAKGFPLSIACFLFFAMHCEVHPKGGGRVFSACLGTDARAEPLLPWSRPQPRVQTRSPVSIAWPIAHRFLINVCKPFHVIRTFHGFGTIKLGIQRAKTLVIAARMTDANKRVQNDLMNPPLCALKNPR